MSVAMATHCSRGSRAVRSAYLTSLAALLHVSGIEKLRLLRGKLLLGEDALLLQYGELTQLRGGAGRGARSVLHVGAHRCVLCSGGVECVFAHLVAAGDQVDEDAEVRQEDHENDPQRLAPSGEVVASEDVPEHPDEDDNPDE